MVFFDSFGMSHVCSLKKTTSNKDISSVKNMSSKTNLIAENNEDLLEKSTIMFKAKNKVGRHMFLEDVKYYYFSFALLR